MPAAAARPEGGYGFGCGCKKKWHNEICQEKDCSERFSLTAQVKDVLIGDIFFQSDLVPGGLERTGFHGNGYLELLVHLPFQGCFQGLLFGLLIPFHRYYESIGFAGLVYSIGTGSAVHLAV